MDLRNWKGCPPPGRLTMDGRYVRLEPMTTKHADDLYVSFHSGDGVDQRFKYIWAVPESEEKFKTWVNSVQNLDDPIYYAVIDKETGKAGGRQAFLRIDAVNGVVEIGYILWGPLIAKKRAATEALYLFASYVFEQLGYRRLEWKCHNENEPSKRAALRFGFQFEGIFRQHKVMKGGNLDTAWFAIIDKDWDVLKKVFQNWLKEENFDKNGIQKKKLEEFRNELLA